MYSFKFADIGEGIHEGKVGEILVKEGDPVVDGKDVIVVETDKVTTPIASPVNGVISKVLVNVGDTIHVGQELFLIQTEGDSETSIQETKVEETQEIKEEPKKEEASADAASVVGEVKVSNDLLPSFGSQVVEENSENVNSVKNIDILASPVARAIAIENNIDLSTVNGTGPLGRILKEDVLACCDSSKPKIKVENKEAVAEKVVQKEEQTTTKSSCSTGTCGVDTPIETTSIRKAIAKAMKDSWGHVAYTNLAVEIDVTDLWDQRNKFKDLVLKEEGVKLTLLPFIVKAISKALEKFPSFNSIIDEVNGQIIQKGNINIGIAIDTKDGLIVPNVKDANLKSILDIAKEITSLAEKARNKKIQMSDLSNGTFSISNYGSLGVSFGVPVIKYPEVAIAGIGTLETKVKKEGLHFVERKVMYLTVAADHRWIDGGDIGRFAGKVKQYLENFTLLFI